MQDLTGHCACAFVARYRECITEKVTEGKCATDQALDTTDMVEVPNETLYSCLTFGRRKRL